MGDYEKLNIMSEAELREFARFAYVSSPTLLVTHEKRQAFYKQYPEKHPHYNSEDAYQMAFDFESKQHDREDLETAGTTGGTGTTPHHSA